MKSLKQLKEERAMTYQQISDRSGVPVSTIHRVIGGQAKNPGYETVTAIRDALDGEIHNERGFAAYIEEAKKLHAALGRMLAQAERKGG